MGNQRNKLKSKQEKAVIAEVRKSAALVRESDKQEEAYMSNMKLAFEKSRTEALEKSREEALAKSRDEEALAKSDAELPDHAVLKKRYHGDEPQVDFRSIVTQGHLGYVRSVAMRFDPPRWLLINVQQEDSTLCTRMDVKLWRDPTIQDIISASFVFWSKLNESHEGSQFVIEKNITSFPYLALMNPFTGELIEWEKKEADKHDIQGWLMDYTQPPPKAGEVGAEVQVAVAAKPADPVLVPLGTYGGHGGEWKDGDEDDCKYEYEEEYEEEEGGEMYEDEYSDTEARDGTIEAPSAQGSGEWKET